jgi:hypothetical protein
LMLGVEAKVSVKLFERQGSPLPTWGWGFIDPN